MPDHVVCRLDQLREGRGRPGVAGAIRLALFLDEGGAPHAVDDACLHNGAPLADGMVHDGCVVCPWHGWMYDLATGKRTSSLFGDLPGGIGAYPTWVDDGGMVWVRTPETVGSTAPG